MTTRPPFLEHRAPRRGLPAVALALALVAGCTVGPNDEAPQTATPDLWHAELMRGLAELPAECGLGLSAPAGSP